MSAATATTAAKTVDPNTAIMSAIAELKADQKKFNDGIVGRVGAIEAAKTQEQKQADDAKMAAFSAGIDAEFAAHKGRVTPADQVFLKETALAALATKKFGAVACADGAAVLAALRAKLKATPVHRLFSDSVFDSPPQRKPKGEAALPDLLQQRNRILGSTGPGRQLLKSPADQLAVRPVA